jgi:hypothetical protein
MTAETRAPAVSSVGSAQVDVNPVVTSMRRPCNVSIFDPSVMPSNAIRKRDIHSFSVHHVVATSKWIATLVRPGDGSQSSEGGHRPRCVSFAFNTEREARKFAQAYSPPKMAGGVKCLICSIQFNSKHCACSCRNCGASVCDKCSARWGSRMIPKTFLNNPITSLTVRVCKSCVWLSNAFCMALLQGKYENALKFHETGNVNLRCSFADIHKEAM